MTDTQQLPISIQPTISYPQQAEIGKTYLMTIDLTQTGNCEEWNYEEEEYPIYFRVDTTPLFKNKPIGEPAVVLHRFGGTYGAAKFLLTAADKEMEGEIRVTLVSAWGVPLKMLRLPDVSIAKENINDPGGVITQPPPPPPPKEESKTFEVKTIILIDDSINLQTFDFQVAVKSLINKWAAISYRSQQATGFIQNLANDTQLEMMLILGDTFMMGSPPEESEPYNFENPQHSVTVQPFFMGKYQVTQAQWRFVAQLPQVKRELEQDPSKFKGDNRPVEKVSWYDAVEFCDRLSQYTGRTYRLPSEAEWEYACRAGTTTPFHFGETITTDLANYDGNQTYGQGPKGVYREETTEVGSFGAANNFGLYDMHGNVWEWCLDDWHNDYTDAPTDGSAWFHSDNNLSDKSERAVLRGGSWFNYPKLCRSAYRNNDDRDERDGIYYNLGFRVVCVVGRTFR